MTTTDTDKNISITMLRKNLDNIPLFPLPDGYTIRNYSPGDEHEWVRIQSAADIYNTLTIDLFYKKFGHDKKLLAERQLFLTNADGEAIGTATAWFNNNYHNQPYGRIHWVAIHPDYQGKGLAKPLLSATCTLLKKLKHNNAYLITSTGRPAAISLYRKFGFQITKESTCQ